MTECGCYNYDEYLGRTESEGYFHSEDCKYPKLLEQLNHLISELEKGDNSYQRPIGFGRGLKHAGWRLRQILEQI